MSRREAHVQNPASAEELEDAELATLLLAGQTLTVSTDTPLGEDHDAYQDSLENAFSPDPDIVRRGLDLADLPTDVNHDYLLHSETDIDDESEIVPPSEAAPPAAARSSAVGSKPLTVREIIQLKERQMSARSSSASGLRTDYANDSPGVTVPPLPKRSRPGPLTLRRPKLSMFNKTKKKTLRRTIKKEGTKGNVTPAGNGSTFEFPCEQVDMERYSGDDNKQAIQHAFPAAVEVLNKRAVAKKMYLQEQQKLQAEFEKKSRALHTAFLEENASLANQFQSNKKPEEQSISEKEGLAKHKLELEKLKKMWFTVSVAEWDSYAARNFSLSSRPDLWENVRRGQDANMKEKTGSADPKDGEASNWVYNILSTEQGNYKVNDKQKDATDKNLSKNAIKVAGIEDNSENRGRAVKALREIESEGGSVPVHEKLRHMVLALVNGTLSEEKKKNLLKAQEKIRRVVVIRVTELDQLSENLKCVMVLDRNGRPCVGGLPPPPAPAEPSSNEVLNGHEDNIEGYVEGHRTTEPSDIRAREYILKLEEILKMDGISILNDDDIAFFKDLFNSNVPHITYQRVHGFQVANNNLNAAVGENTRTNRNREVWNDASDFQLVDLGFKLGLEPLVPLEEYDQRWRNGVLYSLRHVNDGPVRFVGFNETGFGFFEDKPVSLYTQQIKDSNGTPIGVNIIHMTLFDTNEQISCDTMYLKDDEDMTTNKAWKTFGKDAIGNRLAYRIVAGKGKVEAILYPFQGKVKRAKLRTIDLSHIAPDSWVNVHTTGQSTLRLARIKAVPTGMILGQCPEEIKSVFPPTPFLEMLRIGQRGMAEIPGLVDVEIFTEDSALLSGTRLESWPVECLIPATEAQIEFIRELHHVKEQEFRTVEKDANSLTRDVKHFLADRSKRHDKGQFLQEAEALSKDLESMKVKIESQLLNQTIFEDSNATPSAINSKLFHGAMSSESVRPTKEEVLDELEEAQKLLQKNIEGVKRAVALIRRSKVRSLKKRSSLEEHVHDEL